MKVDQVINCSFEHWYPLFQNLTFKSEIIELDEDILNYLKSNESIILPKKCQEELDASLRKNKQAAVDSFDDSDEWTDEINDDSNAYPEFDEFDRKVLEVINKFNGKIFIKLNWSSPKDAQWSLNKLSCQSLSDVYILLKASDFIQHDLIEPFSDCIDLKENKEKIQNLKYVLVAREWLNINPSMEFRCFVRKNKLIGISQRECRTFYQILIDNKSDILERIKLFYLKHLHEKFLDDSYTVDLALGKKTIKIVDFNPFGNMTDSLLFSWDELLDQNNFNASKDVDFRLIDSEIGIQKSQTHSIYGQPIDFLANSNLISNIESSNELNSIDKDDDDDDQEN